LIVTAPVAFNGEKGRADGQWGAGKEGIENDQEQSDDHPKPKQAAHENRSTKKTTSSFFFCVTRGYLMGRQVNKEFSSLQTGLKIVS
jgi:uncharacterized protein YgiB involved in biofilm formation